MYCCSQNGEQYIVLMIEIMFIYLLESKTNGGENCQEFHLNTCIQLRLLKHPPENS